MQHRRQAAELAERRQRGREVDRRHLEPQTEIVQQRDDLRGDRDVEGLGDVVGDQDGRLGADRIDDHRPLHHPAGELGGIFPVAVPGRWDMDLAQKLDDALPALARRPFRPHAAQFFGDLAADRNGGIERGLRLRSDIGDVASDAECVPAPRLQDVGSREGDGSATIGEGFGQPVGERAAEHGLAGAALSIDPENL